jgi:PAS domain S-box-containing protein
MSAARKPPSRSSRHAEPHGAEICRLLVERVREYAIFMLDPDGRIISWNEGAARIKGYEADEIIGRHMSTFYSDADREAGLPQKLLETARTEGRVENEGWRVRKDGTKFWADVVITALRDDDGELVGYGKVTRDLTARKRAEQELGELSGRLLQLQDEERRQIAGDLHDSTSPLLTRLVARLYTMRQMPEIRQGEASHAIDETIALAEATSKMVRTVFSLLHPPLLDDAGLLASLRWFLETFSARTGVRVDAQLPDLMPRPPRDQEVALFRLTQEWITRMQRRGVSEIALRVTMSKDKLELRIWSTQASITRDDTPFEPAMMIANRERMRILGGRLDANLAGAGIIATLPVRGSTRANGAPI